MGRKLFVTATDTGSGKTYVTSQLIRMLLQSGLNASALKPVACGCDDGGINEDVQQLLESQSLNDPGRINLYSFNMAASPHIAAAAEGKAIDPDPLVAWCEAEAEKREFCLIEGVGGLMVPLQQHYLVSDWLAQMQPCEVMLIVGARLGCINHALLTITQLKHIGIPPRYVVINDVVGDDMTEAVKNTLQALLPAGSDLITIPCRAEQDDFGPLLQALLAN